MDIIDNNKYKIYTGLGSSILIFFIYLYYKYKNKEKDIILNDNNNIKNIINKQNETDRIIKILLVKLTKFMKYNKLNNDTLLLDRLNKASLFNKDFHTIRIAVDSINYNKDNCNCIKCADNPNKITYLFTNSDDQGINGLGIGIIHNVIGFKLIKAIIPNSSYNINNNNCEFVYKIDGNVIVVKLKKGIYSPESLVKYLNNLTNFKENLKIIYDCITLKFTIYSKKPEIFEICWDYNEKTKILARYMGFYPCKETGHECYESDIVIDMSTPYVDLVVKQIPRIACIDTPCGKHIIDRIPLDVCFGENKYYEPNCCDNKQNYFLPISLDRLDIVLEDPVYNTIYDSQNLNNSFEFELTVIKNTKNVGLFN
jgi:hypothetical protein